MVDTERDGAESEVNGRPALTVEQLLARGEVLLHEVDTFKRASADVEISNFKKFINMDLTFLRRHLEDKGTSDGIEEHKLRSCNTPFAEALWEVCKGCTGVIAVKKSCWSPDTRCRNSVVVDIVSDGGREWVKVSTITPGSLLMEMAQEGWVGYESSDEDDEANSEGLPASDYQDDSESAISIIKTTDALLKAAMATRVRYRRPRIRLVLPRIHAGQVPQIDMVLDRIRARNITVQTADQMVESTLTLAQALPSMCADELAAFSDTVNIDCTILLALVSDLSHGRVAKEDWHHRFLSQQIESERQEQLLPTVVYPAMGSHQLVCTAVAAKRMREIVETLGTDNERARTAIILGDPLPSDTTTNEHNDNEQRRALFQTLSQYPVPPDWQLPISIVDDTPNLSAFLAGNNQASTNALPTLARTVISRLSGKTDINKSVFFFGWRMQYTTLTSNRVACKEIERLVEDVRAETGEDDALGPAYWLCNNARSLVGKEKTRRGAASN